MNQKETGKIKNAIPGYMGYHQKNQRQKIQEEFQQEKISHIPGYNGHIPKIHSENLYGKTFGKITYEIMRNQEDHHDQFLSTAQQDFVDPEKVQIKPVLGVRCLQDTVHINRNYKKELLGETDMHKDNCSNEQKSFIKETIAGYQGHNPGIYAENVFGKTYKEAQELAIAAKKNNEKIRQEILLQETQGIPNIV